VTLTCLDAQGASASCTASVTVVDQTAPGVTCPASRVAECVNGGAAVDFAADAMATDNCGVNAFSCAPPSGSTFALGTTPLSCTATDTSGNTASCAFDVTVADTKPPVVRPSSGGQLSPPNHKYVTKTLADCNPVIQDQCQGTIDLASAHPAITCVTSDEPDNDGGDGNTTQDIVILSPTSVNLRAERSGNGDGRVYTIHFRVTDAAGNAGEGVCVVTVPLGKAGDDEGDSGGDDKGDNGGDDKGDGAGKADETEESGAHADHPRLRKVDKGRDAVDSGVHNSVGMCK
jgi:hypothetical protein